MDPFSILGLPPRPDLADADVRAAWRRIAAATHPDRADGGDPARFAAAAGAYTSLRTSYDRGEAYADLIQHREQPARSARSARLTAPLTIRRGRRTTPRGAGPAASPEVPAGTGAPEPAGGARRRRSWRASVPGRFLARVRRGRPAVLALRMAIAAGVSAGAVAAVGWHPSAPAMIAGALTWLILTARHDLAPPPDPPIHDRERFTTLRGTEPFAIMWSSCGLEGSVS
jgi:hypothetical protein